jgi:glycosyltransferase involved in cell wall biosynthesis
VVSAEPPSEQSTSGFAPRLYQFLKAAHQRMDVTLALINLSAPGAQPMVPDPRPVDRLRVFTPPPSAWRGRDSRGRLLRAFVQYPLDPLPYQCYPRRLPALREFLRTQRPDAVVLYLPYLSHLIDHCPAGTPVIAALEEPWEWVIATSLGSATRKDRWLSRRETARFVRLYRRIDRRVAAVLAISDAERTYFSEMMTPEKIQVIPHGIDPSYFRPRDDREPDIDVLVVGDLRAQRNFTGAVRAWETAQAADGAGDLHWAFVGQIDPDVASRLRATGCTVTGPVDDVRPYYERARCVLVASSQGRGVKTTSLQAWAMRRPLVASPVGAQALPASPGDNILIGETAETLVAHLRAVLTDPELARRLADNGRCTVERLRDSSILAESFAQLCLDTIAGAAGGESP